MTPDDNFETTARTPMARRTVALFIVAFWIGHFSLLTTRRLMFVPDETVTLVLPRAFVTVAGMGLSYLILHILGRVRGRSVGFRIGTAVGLILVATILHSLVNIAVFHIYDPELQARYFSVMNYVEAVTGWLWVYVAVTAMIFALQASFQLRDRELEVSELQRVAHEAQLRALRYQLNPHFMFNTLNSVTALIARDRPKAAEEMVENLADFLRASLSIDPLASIPLSRELELQTLYLAIEQVRFADRLDVKTNIEPEARRALVPSLITQPIIENAIRHGVAVSSDPTELVITARRQGELLVLSIVNSVSDEARSAHSKGTGIGLANVRERLRAQCPGGVFFAGPRDDKHFEVRFEIPFASEPRSA